MIVRYENTKTDQVLVINENDKFLGTCSTDEFIDCMEERDGFEENEYQYFYMDKNKLMKAIKNNGTNN